MTTLISLTAATTVVLIGGVGLLLSQEQPPTPAPVSPAPATTVRHHDVEVRPLPVTADPTARTKAKKPIPAPSDGVGATWNARLERNNPRGFDLDYGTLPRDVFDQRCTVPLTATWEATLDGLAKDAGQVWRMRGDTVEFIPQGIAAKLDGRLDGRQAPAGTRTHVLEWFAKHTHLAIDVDPSLGPDDGRLLGWSAQVATNEAWLDGVAAALKATAFLTSDGSVLFWKAPAVVPLDNDPKLGTTAWRLVYQAPPPARLDTELILDFNQEPITEVVKRFEHELQYPVELDPRVVASGIPTVTLRVEDMRARYCLEFVAKLTGLEMRVLADRVLLTTPILKAGPRDDAAPALPSAPQ